MKIWRPPPKFPLSDLRRLLLGMWSQKMKIQQKTAPTALVMNTAASLHLHHHHQKKKQKNQETKQNEKRNEKQKKQKKQKKQIEENPQEGREGAKEKQHSPLHAPKGTRAVLTMIPTPTSGLSLGMMQTSPRTALICLPYWKKILRLCSTCAFVPSGDHTQLTA